MDKKKNIEQILKSEFRDFRVDPSPEVWAGISRKLRLKSFLKPGLRGFNILHVLTATVLGVATLLIFLPDKEKTSMHSPDDLPARELIMSGTKQAKTASADEVEENLSGANQEKNDISAPDPEIIIKPNDKAEKVPADSEIDLKTDTEEIAGDNFTESKVNEEAALLPVALFTADQIAGCVPLKVDFYNYSENSTSYTWNFGDGGQSKDLNPVYIFDEPGEYIVSLTASGKDGQESTIRELIKVYPLPELIFTHEKMSADAAGITVYFYNYSQGGINYDWDFGDNNTSIEKDPAHIYQSSGIYYVSLRVESENGCITSKKIELNLETPAPEIRIPNAFIPNTSGPNGGYYTQGDLSNEIFHPVIDQIPAEYNLRIFNRKGNLIFESNDLYHGWDGYYMQELQPQDVYVYKIRVKFNNGESRLKMGDVTLFRQPN